MSGEHIAYELIRNVFPPDPRKLSTLKYVPKIPISLDQFCAPRIKARMYFGIASNDDERQPDAKDKLKQAFAAARVPAEIEVYSAQHGWCVPDMPMRDGVPIYNKAEAERAWAKLVALYKVALA